MNISSLHLVPDDRPAIIEEYFTLLTDAVTSTYNKLHQELPTWIDEFEFSDENQLKQELKLHEDHISEILGRLDQHRQRKSVLVLTGDELVASVIELFRQGFKVDVDATEEFREDFKLLDDEAVPFCLCEVKGTNRGLKREYINQADSHRERSGFAAEFPTVLIINTIIKNARSVSEKDQEIAHEQVLHARKMNILILRTLDLLELLRSHLDGDISTEEVKRILSITTGWLRVDREGTKQITGDEPTHCE